MPRALTITWKDLRVLLRDTAALGVLLGMPMILIFILGSAFGGMGEGEGGGGAPVAIVNLDAGAAAPADAAPAEAATDVGGEIVSGLMDNEAVTGLFGIEEFDDAEEVREMVERGDLTAALIVPEDLTASLNAGEPVELEVLRDPGSDLSAGIWESIVRALATDLSRVSIIAQTAGETAARSGLPPEVVGAVVGTAVQQATGHDALDDAADAGGPPIEVDVRTQAASDETEIGGIDFYSLSMTSMFLVFGAMFGAFGFITERREQTLARLLATPTTRSAVVGGKMAAIWVLGMMQFTILYVFTRFALGVKWGSDPLATYVVAAAMLVAVTGLAVLIASLAKTERGAGGLGALLVQLMALIGGVFFPITILPEWLQPIRYASIMGWGLEGLQKIQIHGAGLTDVITPIVVLVGMGAAFFAFGIWRLRME